MIFAFTVPLILQHTFLAVVPVVIGALLNRRLTRVEVKLNGHVARCEDKGGWD